MKTKGYSTLRQITTDIRLYTIVIDADPEREKGETISEYLKKKIKNGMDNASPKLKKQLNKTGLKLYDLNLIAIHSLARNTRDLHRFLENMTDNCSTQEKIRKILSSAAFKSGKLPKLYTHLPKKLSSKGDLINYIKSRRCVNNMEMSAIGSHYLGREYIRILKKAEEEGEVKCSRGEWYV